MVGDLCFMVDSSWLMVHSSSKEIIAQIILHLFSMNYQP